jgi:hypothetical protein
MHPRDPSQCTDFCFKLSLAGSHKWVLENLAFKSKQMKMMIMMEMSNLKWGMGETGKI